MKTNIKLTILLLTLVFGFQNMQAQQLQNYYTKNKEAINVFDVVKNDVPYNGLKVKLGGAFALQWQALNHSNDLNNLIDLGNDFNLPTANMTIDAQLADGLRVKLDLYLASNHHHETWVKGGYLQMDKLDFISPGFLQNFMKYATIKIGQMENNYGDAHFRRSDNASAFLNPFIGNYLMDGFVTEIGAELYYLRNNFIFMGGFSNGKLNQSVVDAEATSSAIIGKLGYDKQINNNTRFRLTGSMYYSPKLKSVYLYSGDRTGSRFYNVIQAIGDDPDFRAGRVNPGFKNKLTSFMINSLIKYKGLEFFGTYETATGGDKSGSTETRTWNQFASDIVYRFGKTDNFYAGFKYNTASGKLSNADANKVSVNRIETGLGWYMTKNVMSKLIYVNQDYKDYPATSNFAGANFKGFAFEAVVSF
ncbi:hypothetical protein [Tenacibaculum sp. UWU-22]|uniref:hypothetical protein n=1 Tax=Tenacibaculum sp. UWU-22 TaxID=3234187 RepID=UPI0034DB66BA